MSELITIAHLYPREMNIYGDMGNIITLTKRLEWRGYRSKVIPVEVGEAIDWDKVDLVFGGGGQDSGQSVVAENLVKHGPTLKAMADAGTPMLLICGLYQLFGREFITASGEGIPGIGIFQMSTKAGSVRMIGNVISSTKAGVLVGFENHSGQTKLDKSQESLGKVVKGYGNNLKSGQEGAVYREVIGTYLHGPVLPKNPALADHLLLAALKRRYGIDALKPLDDGLELEAARIAASRPR